MSKKKVKEIEIELLRRKEGFLPCFSNAFFEKIEAFFRKGIGIIYLMFIFCMLFFENNGMWRILQMSIVGIILMVILLIIINQYKWHLEVFGYQIEKDRIIKKAWGREREISYEDIKCTLQNKKVVVTTKGICVPVQRRRIMFGYEVGDANQLRHNRECYKLFCEALGSGVDMPPMQINCIDYIDKIYFYRRSYRKCIIVLCVLQFIFLCINLHIDMHKIGFIVDAVIALTQYFCLFRIYKSICLGGENAALLYGKLREETNTTIRIKAHRKWEFILVAAAVIALNYLTLTIAWI